MSVTDGQRTIDWIAILLHFEHALTMTLNCLHVDRQYIAATAAEWSLCYLAHNQLLLLTAN